jgi:hypothetical protein
MEKRGRTEVGLLDFLVCDLQMLHNAGSVKAVFPISGDELTQLRHIRAIAKDIVDGVELNKWVVKGGEI